MPEQDVQVRSAEFLRERGIDRVCADSFREKLIPGLRYVVEPDPTVRVGVTGALVGIEDSGSLVLVGGEGHPLTASLLPDIHIAILRVWTSCQPCRMHYGAWKSGAPRLQLSSQAPVVQPILR